MEQYTKEYFIKKFTLIPDKEIGTGGLEYKCALYHCGLNMKDGVYHTPEAEALIRLFGGKGPEHFSAVWKVNDNINGIHPGNTPKERILNKLNSL